MKYYLIKQNNRLRDLPQLSNWYSLFPVEECKFGRYSKIPDRIVFPLKNNPNIYFPKIFFTPCFLIDEDIKDILELYEPNMLFHEMYFLESKHELCHQYFMPHIRQINCLHDEVEFNINHSEVKQIILDKAKIEDFAVFECGELSNRHIIVRQDFLESMLRRGTLISYEEILVRGEIK